MNIGGRASTASEVALPFRMGLRSVNPEPSTGSMKNEGTSRFYVPHGFPAVPDFDLTRAIIDTAKEMELNLSGKYITA